MGQTYTAEDYLAAAQRALADGNQDAAAELQARAAALSEPPTQRLRAVGQGLTLGFADELAAAAQHPLSFAGSVIGSGDQGAAYEKSLGEERGALEQYRKDYPKSSLGWELGGAVLPVAASMIAAPFTGGGSAAAVAPQMGKMAATALSALKGAAGGAKAGAVYGFGSGEGGALNRAANAGTGAIGGGVFGGALGAVGGAVKAYVAKGLVDWVRAKFGDRMAGPVANEIQRLAEMSGMTADEIIDGVRSGQLMAENKTLNNVIRKFYAEGGPAGAEIKNVMTARPGETRRAAQGEIQGALSTSTDPNTLRSFKMGEQAAKEAEGQAYEGIWGATGGGPVTGEVQAALSDAFQRVPGVAKELTAYTLAKTKTTPYYTIADDGSVAFTREPTLQEAEIARRFLQGKADEAYRQGSPWGEVFKGIEQAVREPLDASAELLKQTRAKWAQIKSGREAFDAGLRAVSRTPDEMAVLYADIEKKGPEAVAAFRAGLTTAVRAGLAKPSAAPAMLRNLSNPETGPGTALRLALPPGAADAVTAKIGVAEGAQAASSHVLGGPSTAPTMLAPSVGAAGNVAQDISSGMGGDLMSWARLIGRVTDAMSPGLTDAQRLQVARIVLSKDPTLVERALKDTTLIGQLQKNTAAAIDTVLGAGVRAGPSAAAPYTDINRQNGGR